MTTKLNPYDIPVPSIDKDPRGFFETSVVVLRLLVQEDEELLAESVATGENEAWIEMNRRVLENRRADLQTARRNLAAHFKAEAENASALGASEDSQSTLEVARIRKDAVAVQLAEAFAAAGPDAFTDGHHRDTCEAWVARYRYVRDEYKAAMRTCFSEKSLEV